MQPGVIPATKAIVGIMVVPRQSRPQISTVKRLFRPRDFAQTNRLGEKMWRNGDKAAQPRIWHSSRIDRRNRSPITMAHQKAAFKPDGIQNLGQNQARLTGHVIERARQSGRVRAAIARPRIGADPPACRGTQPLWKIAPKIARP